MDGREEWVAEEEGRVPMLPVAKRWWDRREVAPGLWVLTEPHVDPLDRANVFFLQGRDRNVLIDAGMGIVPLRPALADLLDKPVLAVATHAHGDHIGSLHEFAERAAHRLEAAALAEPKPGSLFAAGFPPGFLEAVERAGYARPPELLITALPRAGYDPHSYRRVGAPPTRLLEDGDAIDTGDRRFTVLHLPGHSPGQIGLFEEATGTLFAGDAVYDGPLLWEGAAGMSLPAYAATLARLRALPLRVVHGGHGASFGRERLVAICEDYLARWRALLP